MMLNKRIWKRIIAAIMSCTLIVSTAGTSTVSAITKESNAKGNIRQGEESPQLSKILAECKEIKNDSNQIILRKGETVSVKGIYSDGLYVVTAAIMSTGELYCWGYNSSGQVGNGTTDNQLTPVKVLDNVKSVIIDDDTMTAITETGELYCWGDNTYGQIGNGTTDEDDDEDDSYTPIKVLDNVKSVSVYGSTMRAITETGELYCWGYNEYGQVGNGTTDNQLTPVKVLDNVKSVSAVSVDDNIMRAITETGELYCWGDNECGQVGNGTTDSQLTPVKVLDNVKSVSVYGGTMRAITETGELYCWGYNSSGQVGNGTTDNQLTPVKVLDNVKSVDIHEHEYTMRAITETGELYCWGYNKYGQVGNGTTDSQLTPVKVLDNVKFVDIYRDTMRAITETGELYCWGRNEYGEVGNGTTDNQLTPVKVLDNVKSLDCCSAITETGELYCWESNEYGEVGNGTTDNQLTPVKVLDNVKSVSVYGSTMRAITETGELYCWGSNEYGEVGNGTTDNQLTPVKVLDNVKSVSVDDETMTVITETGELYCWGRNYGRVGNGTTDSQLTPVKVLDNVKSVSVYGGTMRAITKTGELYCWGSNEYGEVGNGTTDDQLTPIRILPYIIQKQKIAVKIANKKYTGDILRKAGRTFEIGASAMTDISYKVINGSKYISVDEDGFVTVKKNTPKGTYKIRVLAEANYKYEKDEAIVTVTVTAANPVLQKANINWNLKNNKTVKVSTDVLMYNYYDPYYSHRKTETVTIKKFKKISRGKKYKVTFTVEENLSSINLSKREVYDMVRTLEFRPKSKRLFDCACYDYKTGKEIKKKNSYNVKMKEKGKSSGKSKFNGYGSSVSFPKKITRNVTITYPKNYKDLCILCYGYREHDRLYNDNKIDFTKRTKNDKLYFHGMRVK